MLSLLNLILLGVLAIPIFILTKYFTKQHIPKGLKELPKTSGWPLIGVLFPLKKPLFAYLYRLQLEHGPIFKFTMGCRDIIVINTSSMMHRTLKEMGNNFSGRWNNIIVQAAAHDSGIFFKDKEWWATQKSFVLRVLRDFGLGKQRSQDIVTAECTMLLKEVEESCGSVLSTNKLFTKFMVNVIAKIVMNLRFERTDSNYIALTRLIERVVQKNNPVLTLLLMYPVLEKYPFLSKILLWFSGRDQQLSNIYKYIIEIIVEHEKRFNPENEGEDLIDIFLQEKHKLEISGVKDHTFTDWQLIRNGFELFAAGYETTSTTLSWSMLYLAKNQEVQERVHKEILDVVGCSRSPILADKSSLIYTQAVMDEIYRSSSIVPLSIPHRVFENTEIDGYFIPKNSIVFPNIYGVHRDKDTWEKPFEFYPPHFLSQIDGVEKYTPRDELMPFSIGKRQCLGEGLARLEFFTFLTSILQRFKITLPEGMTDEEFNRISVGTDGTVRAPIKTDVVFELRQQ